MLAVVHGLPNSPCVGFGISWRGVDAKVATFPLAKRAEQRSPNMGPSARLDHTPAAVHCVLDGLTDVLVWVPRHDSSQGLTTRSVSETSTFIVHPPRGPVNRKQPRGGDGITRGSVLLPTSCDFVTQTIPRTSRTRWSALSQGIGWATLAHYTIRR